MQSLRLGACILAHDADPTQVGDKNESPGAVASLGHLCTPSLFVSLGSLLLNCAREPSESKVKKKQKVRIVDISSTCFARCLLSFLGRMLWYLICSFPTPCGNSEQSEQDE